MKLYFHPVSTTSRPIMLFAAESGIELEYQVVDLMTGEHLGSEYARINPNKQVPVLEDGDFRLTESSAILKYLADKIGSPAYPQELKARARVNEAMDWLNANIYRDYGYGLVYPQIFPHHKRPAGAASVLAFTVSMPPPHPGHAGRSRAGGRGPVLGFGASMSERPAVRRHGKISIIDLPGRVVYGDGDEELRVVIDELVSAGDRRLLLNMEKVSFMDSSGIVQLIGGYKRVIQAGGKLKLLKPVPKVRNILGLMNLIGVLELYEDEAEAIGSF